jgi:aminopeptidase N
MSLLNTNAYPKGAWVLHTLRGMIGDSVFYRGLRKYYQTYLHGNALSSDFARVMATESHTDLGWYFQQALMQPGFPVLEARVELDAGHLLLTILQVQKEAWGVFRMPNLKVRLGDRELTVNVQGRETKVATHWESDRPPAKIEIDPDGWWLFQVRVAP